MLETIHNYNITNEDLFMKLIDAIKIDKKLVRFPELKEIDDVFAAYQLLLGLRTAIYDVVPMTNVCCSIGKKIMIREKISIKDEEVSRTSFKIGYFLVNVLNNRNITKLIKADPNKIEMNGDDYKIKTIKNGEFKQPRYYIVPKDEEYPNEVDELIECLPLIEMMETEYTYTLPMFEEPLNWYGHYNDEGGELIRKATKNVRRKRVHHRVLEVINKTQSIKYEVNPKTLKVYNSISKTNKLFTLKHKNITFKQKLSTVRANGFTLDIANIVNKRNGFYEYNFLDTRGRLYASTSYLNHGGSKLSKSLIRRHNKKPIGTEGLFWIKMHMANCLGYDKANIDDRVKLIDDNLDFLLEIYSNPIKYQWWWQDADSPFEALACGLELVDIYNSYNPTEYKSGLLIAFDASCSGLQILSALSRDDKGALLCNLTGETRGDYYQMIGDEVWKKTRNTRIAQAEIDGVLKEFKAIKSEKEYTQFINDNRKRINKAAACYWGQPKFAKAKRKLVKRPCMTYFYSCKARTMAVSLYKDFAPDYEDLEPIFCLWLSYKIYNTCKRLMPNATQLMDLFVELGMTDSKSNKQYGFTVPYTGFEFEQSYVNYSSKQIKVQYKGKKIWPRIRNRIENTVDLDKIRTGSSPNSVHSLDAMFLFMLILNAVDYEVTVIHDSFSTIPADAGKLYEDVRTTFVKLFEDDVLADILVQKDKENPIKYGNLDVNDVINQEHFCS